ncbi:unnamed protein product [Blumeria hordei]|uniref:Uncharacterized protein n=1 Tax=Blumeria hordei TaxID=2867405 RepID=A0A383UIR2_BLUHO|nr:unnamed protein product [Blumeria hordei]
MSQAKLLEFDTGGKENVSDKVMDLNITIFTWINNYHQGFIDYIPLEIFQEDFVEWDPDSFAIVYPPIRRRFKTFLMSRGIYVGCENNKRSTVAQKLVALLENDLEDLPQWPKRELDKMIRYGPEFQLLVFNEGIQSTVKVANNNNSDETSTVSANLKSTKTDFYRKSDGYKKKPEWRQKAREGMEIDSDNDSGKTYILKWAKETPTRSINTLRMLMDLGKLYVNPHDTFSTMLRDAAHNFYFRHLAEHLEDLTFNKMVHKVKRRFHTKTEEQNYLAEWQVFTIQKVIKDNPDKITLQCLDLVIKKLQKIYEALRYYYSHKSHSLTGQFFAACQGVSACAQAQIRPHNRYKDACAELRSTVKVHIDCTTQNSGLFHQTEEHFDNKEVDNGQYFVDHRYGGKLGYVQGGLQSSGGRGSFKGGLRGGSSSNDDRQNIYFVCKKAGC